MTWLLALSLLLPLPSAAQARRKAPPAKVKVTAPAAVRWVVESLAVAGNHNYSSDRILSVSGLKAGQPAGKEDFESARARLVATGVFETVGYQFQPAASGKGYAVTFQVLEVAQVYPFRFDRLDATPEELSQQLQRADPLFLPKIPASDVVLTRYAKVLEDFLASRRKPEKVVAKLAPDESAGLVVVFSPATPAPSVAAVTFTGNQVIPEVALREAIIPTAIGSVYSEKGFRQLLDMSIRPLYEARGRIRVSFPTIQIAPAKDVKGVLVTVEVSESDPFELRDVHYEGEGLPLAELQSVADFKTGDVANFAEIQAGLDRIKKRLRREGYMQPETRVERKILDAKKTVDLVVHVEKGPRYTFGTLKIQGLDMHGEAALRKMWTLKPGAPFNAEYPDYFLNRVREDGIFDNLGKTKSALDVNDQARTVDVTLIFQ